MASPMKLQNIAMATPIKTESGIYRKTTQLLVFVGAWFMVGISGAVISNKLSSDIAAAVWFYGIILLPIALTMWIFLNYFMIKLGVSRKIITHPAFIFLISLILYFPTLVAGVLFVTSLFYV